MSSLTDKCIFRFVLSLLISRVAKVKYRNDSIWRPGAYLPLLPQRWSLIRKRALIYFVRKCRWFFCTGALIEKFKEDEHAITETKYGRLLE